MHPSGSMPDFAPQAGERLQQRIDDLRALVPELGALDGPADPSEIGISLLDLLERKQRHLIEDNVRLAALRELTEDLLRDPEEERVLRTITLYLRHAYGVSEVMVLSRAEDGSVRGYRTRSEGTGICEAIRWSRETVAGSSWERALDGEAIRGAAPASDGPGKPAPLPFILPLRTGMRAAERSGGARGGPGGVMGLLALRPGGDSASGTDPLEIDQLVFQASTLLESVRNHRWTERERRFRECLLEAMGDGLIATSGAGALTAVNPAAAALLGLDRDDLLGEPIERLEQVAPQIVCAVRECLQSGERSELQEAWIEGAGERFPVRVSIVAFDEGPEERGGIVATLLDLRPSRAMQEELRRLDRLAALGRFASAVAHEIRNPLAAIRAGVEFLGRYLPAEHGKDVGFLREEVARMDRIVRDLLEPTRAAPLQKSRSAVAELVERACQAVEPQAREQGVRYLLHPPLEETFERCVLDLDFDRMLQVMVNLLRNAVEVSPAGGDVEIGWSAASGSDNGERRIWIRDHGPGVTEEQMAHLFEPFYSTKPKGTGLGLYVSHGVVERHGGQLRLEPAAGGGSLATILLPANG